MKHLILSAITAVTLLVAATTMLWSHSLFTEHQAVAMVIGQIQQIESPLQNTVEGMAKAMPPELVLSRLGNLQGPKPIRTLPVVEVAAAMPNYAD